MSTADYVSLVVAVHDDAVLTDDFLTSLNDAAGNVQLPLAEDERWGEGEAFTALLSSPHDAPRAVAWANERAGQIDFDRFGCTVSALPGVTEVHVLIEYGEESGSEDFTWQDGSPVQRRASGLVPVGYARAVHALDGIDLDTLPTAAREALAFALPFVRGVTES